MDCRPWNVHSLRAAICVDMRLKYHIDVVLGASWQACGRVGEEGVETY